MGYTAQKLSIFIFLLSTCLFTACSKKSHLSYQAEIEGLVYNTKYCYKSQVQTTQQQFQQMLQYAEQQNPNAEYLAGLAYYYGINTSINKKLGMQYLFKAAKQGNDRAMFIYSVILMHSPNKKNYHDGKYWLKIAYQNNNRHALVNYSIMHISDFKNKKNKFNKLLQQQAKNDGYAQFMLGYMIMQHDDNLKNTEQEIFYFKSSFNNPNTPIYTKSKAASQLNLIYYSEHDDAQAKYWQKQAHSILEKYNCINDNI
jgi:TPR repeat protein